MKFQFPQEIKDVLGALADDTRWNILEAIVNSDNKIAYSEIKKVLNVSDDKKGPLNYHLKELQKAGWIRNSIEDREGTRNKSFYSLSKFAQKVMEGALQAMDRRSYPQKENKHFVAFSDTANYIENIFMGIDSVKIEPDYPTNIEIEVTDSDQLKKQLVFLECKSFFDSPRTVSETVHELREHGVIVNSLDISKALAAKVSGGEFRKEIEGKNRMYIAPLLKRSRTRVSLT
ncbi:MAG: winged helix-turn-helix transcriptional regulator [Thaumarchaeota archaeon]|nr:winged helix-turn-helix transcriptional regulator [Nitrososphaerota archaeon]